MIGKAWAAEPWGLRNYSEEAPSYAKDPDNSQNSIYTGSSSQFSDSSVNLLFL